MTKQRAIVFVMVIFVTTFRLQAQYCTPQYTYGCQVTVPIPTADFINNFSISGAVSNFSNIGTGCNFQPNNYIYYSSLTAQVARGCSFNFSVQCGPPSTFQQGFGIWIDWNNDNSFMGAGEFVWNSGVAGFNLFTGTINVPAGVSLGTKRMRVRCTYLSPPTHPCNLYDFGECEDYNLEVVNSGAAPPVVSNVTICSGTQTMLTATGSGLIQWFNAPTGGALLQNGPNFMTPVLTSTTTYYVQSTLGNCPSARVPVTVSVAPNFSVSLSASEDTVCANETTTLNASGGLNYQWSPLTQVVSGSGSAVLVSIPSQTTFTVTASNAAGCTSTTTITIFQHTNPIASILPLNPGICQGDTLMLFSGSSGNCSWNGSGIISSSNNDSILLVPASGSSYSLTITDANGCTANSTTTVIVHSLPPISAGPDIFTCFGTSAQLNASGGLNYQWSPSANLNSGILANPTCSATSNTTYTVTGWDANGCHQSDQVDVIINPLPVANTGPSVAICAGQSVQLNANGGSTYLWNPSSGLSNANIANPIANPPNTTSYSLTVIDNNGCTSPPSTPITITVNPIPSAPAINATGPNIFCAGDSVTLISNYTSGNLWSNGSTANSITVHTSGIYSVQHTDINGCVSSSSASVQVVVNGVPPSTAPVATGPLTFCAGGSVQLSMPVGFSGYLWSNGDNTPTTIVNSSGTYSCVVSDANGCSSLSSSVGVTVHANPGPPVIVASGPGTICQGDSLILTAIPASQSYLWSTGDSTQAISVSQAGSYQVNTIDVNGCVSALSSTFNVQHFVPGPPPVIQASGAIPFCQGQTVNLSTNPTLNAYFWSNGASTSSINVSAAGIFSVYGLDANGCFTDTSAAITISVFPVPSMPVISASGPLTFCAGDSVQLSSSIPSGNSWSGGQTSQTISVSQTTIGIQVSYIDMNGCPSPLSQPIDVSVIPLAPTPVITLSGPGQFCAGDSVELICSQAQTYLWTNGETTSNIWVNTSGTYSVEVSDICNPVNPQSSVNITVFQNPVADFVLSVSNTCLPEPIRAINQSSGNGLSYQWLPGDGSISNETDLTHFFQFPGLYDLSLVVTDLNGCTSVKTVQGALEVLSTPNVEYQIEPRITEEFGDAVEGRILTPGIIPGNWKIGELDFIGLEIQFKPEQAGIFPLSFEGQTNQGCPVFFSDSIIVLERNQVFIPSSFTPNGDGKNDLFSPQINGTEESYELIIFNRWGSQIFRTHNKGESWNGEGVTEGTYIWRIRFKGIDGQSIEKVGHVTLYR